MPSPSRRRIAAADRSLLASQNAQIDWPALESITHRDPAGRGLASYRLADGQSLDAGQLRAAALHLANHATCVALGTGFCAHVGDEVTAETDGPPGALFLARALLALGIDVVLVTDRFAWPLLAAGCDNLGLDRALVREFPLEAGAATDLARMSNVSCYNAITDRWIDEFLASFASRGDAPPLSHLIAIERPGPSHTEASFARQSTSGGAAVSQFLAAVPPEDRDVCHTMRGKPINAWTAKTHRLFERIAESQLPITTIGIGDGGNELGMGHFAWEHVCQAVGGEAAGRIACRIGADFALLAGVSNWGGYALGLALAKLLGAADAARLWTAQQERTLIETLVRETPAVDGVTLRREATVDGLEMDVYLQPLTAMRRLLELSDARHE